MLLGKDNGLVRNFPSAYLTSPEPARSFCVVAKLCRDLRRYMISVTESFR
jgi:hypothetical protein